mgnify:CR=1 FL=1
MNVILERTFWLTVINLMLAVTTLGIVLLVAGAAVHDIHRRFTSRRRARREDMNMLRKLGVTMPDGGRPIDEMEELRKQDPGRSGSPEDLPRS